MLHFVPEISSKEHQLQEGGFDQAKKASENYIDGPMFSNYLGEIDLLPRDFVEKLVKDIDYSVTDIRSIRLVIK